MNIPKAIARALIDPKIPRGTSGTTSMSVFSGGDEFDPELLLVPVELDSELSLGVVDGIS
jgi:hypothetical protein